jgi:glyoxylate reductase
MSYKIFVTKNLPEKYLTSLKERGFIVDVNKIEKTLPQKKLIKILKKNKYDGVICSLTDSIDKKVFDAAPSVKIYVNYATGYNNINLTEAQKRKIKIANAPSDEASIAVAEHVFALLFSVSRKIVEADKFIRKGKMNDWYVDKFLGMKLQGKTLGIFGVGRIGGRVAEIANAFGMKVFYTDIKRNFDLEQKLVLFF